MRQFYFAGWHIHETSKGWRIDNVSSVFDSPEQAKTWVLEFEQTATTVEFVKGS